MWKGLLALVGAFSVIVKNDGSFAALVYFHGWLDSAAFSSWPEYRVTHLQSPPEPGQSMTWEAAIFITIKVVSFCDADFDPATKMWTLHPLQRISVAEQREIYIKHYHETLLRFTGIMPSNQRPILEKIHSTKLYRKCVLLNKNS